MAIFHVCTEFNYVRLDLSVGSDRERAQNVVRKLEELVNEGYVFSCEDLGTFSMYAKCFRKGEDGRGFISGSTYPHDGNMHIFRAALNEMKSKVEGGHVAPPGGL